MEILHNINNEGKTIIVVTHNERIIEEEGNCIGARYFQSWYETLASKWMEWRVIFRNDDVQEQVLNSL